MTRTRYKIMYGTPQFGRKAMMIRVMIGTFRPRREAKFLGVCTSATTKVRRVR